MAALPAEDRLTPARLRIVVEIQVVEQAHAICILVGLHLLQVPRHEGHITVGQTIIWRDPVLALTIVCTVPIVGPSHNRRSEQSSCRISGFDRSSILDRSITELLVFPTSWLHVPMRLKPEIGLIVQIEEAHATRIGVTVFPF